MFIFKVFISQGGVCYTSLIYADLQKAFALMRDIWMHYSNKNLGEIMHKILLIKS